MSFLIPFIPLITGLAGIGVGAWTAGQNRRSQEQMNRQNIQMQYDINSQNLAHNEAMTREAWARDDTAYQRKAKDLAAAGLSPHLAAGGSGSGVSAPIKADSQAPRGEAPQIDSGSMIGALSQIGQFGLNMAQLKQTNAQTEAINLQNKMREQEFNFDMSANPLRLGILQRNDQLLEKTITGYQQNLNYALEHGLPVGQSDVSIRRFEYVIDKLVNLRQAMSANGVLANLKAGAQTAASAAKEAVTRDDPGSFMQALRKNPLYNEPPRDVDGNIVFNRPDWMENLRLWFNNRVR